MMDRTHSLLIAYVCICAETLLCAAELDWAVVVVLAPNIFDLIMTGGGSQLVVDVDVDQGYSKRAVQPICSVRDAICAVQNEKLCSPKTQS